MNLLSHHGRQATGNALVRKALAAVMAAIMLSISAGLQGCIENPGPDHRLNQEDHGYHRLAFAQYAGVSVLELSMKRDSGVISLSIASMTSETIDSAAFLLQFGDWSGYTSPGWYHRVSKLDVIVRFSKLQPGAVLEYGAISRDIDLGNTHPTAKLIRYADGAPRGNPLGGVYTGDYSLTDTAGRRSSGIMKGIITVDGNYQFLTSSTGGGIRGDVYGMLDSAGLGEGVWRENADWGPNHPMSLPAPLTLVSGALKGTFHPIESAVRIDSLNCDLLRILSFGK